MRWKRNLEETENAAPPRWMISFSDLEMLLLAFFVMRYAAFSKPSDAVVRRAQMTPPAVTGTVPATSTGSGAVSRPGAPSTNADAEASPVQDATAPAPGTVAGIRSYLRNGNRVITLSDAFDGSGNERLTFDTVGVLHALAGTLREGNNRAIVRAHFTDLNAAGVKSSPWSAAISRAQFVVRKFIDAGVSPDRLGAEVVKEQVQPDRSKNFDTDPGYGRIEIVISDGNLTL